MPNDSEITPAEPRRTFWQRRVRDPIVAQLTQGITPEKIALTVAIGSACALFPLLGFTTLLCFLVALALRLNQPITQLINQALWPLHVPAILLCVRVGEAMFGVPHQLHFVREMHQVWNQPGSLWERLSTFFTHFGPTAWHAVVAWAVIAPLYIIAVYLILSPIVRGIARIRAEAAAQPPAVPPEHPVP
ncbi:MAG: DUF2062 domain-containing protein [Verrucomicrobia bacterium]|nr:DUF2062 domain-containing protein [Verrucomicrobiota bacterium]